VGARKVQIGPSEEQLVAMLPNAPPTTLADQSRRIIDQYVTGSIIHHDRRRYVFDKKKFLPNIAWEKHMPHRNFLETQFCHSAIISPIFIDDQIFA
jgi:hypothetical protein